MSADPTADRPRRPASARTKEDEELLRMGLLEHLEELRTRILLSLAAFTVAFMACWAFHGRIYEFLARPIVQVLEERGENPKLVFLGPTEPFVVYVKVAALAAVFLAAPFVLYQVWRFVAPGLYRRERRMAGPFILVGSVLFLSGGAFAYLVAFPFAVDFLLGMGGQFQASITVGRYLSFLMTVILGMALMFELPMVIFFLARLGLVTPRFLLQHFRWAVVLIFTVAAIITPTPDIINLCVFAVPAVLLYLLGVAAAWFVAPAPARTPESAQGTNR